jgi:PAS domain S-box-containing protein
MSDFPPDERGTRAELLAEIDRLRRRLEEASRRQECLATYRTSHQMLYEAMADAVLMVTPEGDILAANPAAQAMLGMTEEEIIRAGRAGVVDPSDPRLQEHIAERKRTGKARG